VRTRYQFFFWRECQFFFFFESIGARNQYGCLFMASSAQKTSLNRGKQPFISRDSKNSNLEHTSQVITFDVEKYCEDYVEDDKKSS
jgi:hypothetical protein